MQRPTRLRRENHVGKGEGALKAGQPVSHNDASVLLRAIQRKCGVTLRQRTMPGVPRYTSQREADRAKAARMVAAEILEAVARCEALERDR